MAFFQASIHVALAVPFKRDCRIVDIEVFDSEEYKLGAFINAFVCFKLLTQLQ
ncbi:hypothetical protein D3C80_2090950 [compost metagenome]